MSRLRSSGCLRVAGIVTGFFAVLLLVVGCGLALVEARVPQGIPLPILGTMIVLTIVYAYLRYRSGRQEEFLQLLVSVTDGRLPLAAAVRSYLRDRPDTFVSQLTIALLLTPVLPGFVVVWYWLIWRRRFDVKLQQFADLIESGWPLPAALREVGGLATRETRLAAEIGLETGHLGACLHRADRERLTTGWLELVPRVLYPLFVLFFVTGVTEFLIQFIIPKFRKIADDFGVPFPTATRWLVESWEVAGPVAGLIGFGLFVMVVLTAVLVVSPKFRWHFPVVGRWYRWDVRGEILRLLGVMFDARMTASDALHLLASAEEFPNVVHDRLDRALTAVEQGQSLAEALTGADLLPAHMAPLLTAAERTGTLPWALSELGEQYGGRALRAARRASLVVGPVLLLLIAGMVAVVVVGFFVPLIQLITAVEAMT